MKINTKYKVRKVADENIVLVQGRNAGDMTTVVALNESALLLWDNLYGKDFGPREVADCLMREYDVDAETALRDAQKWMDTLREAGCIVED